jgi:hypothetical protein
MLCVAPDWGCTHTACFFLTVQQHIWVKQAAGTPRLRDCLSHASRASAIHQPDLHQLLEYSGAPWGAVKLSSPNSALMHTPIIPVAACVRCLFP